MEIWVHLLKEPHMYLHVVFGEQIALFKEFMVIVDPERAETELFGRLKFDNTVLEVLVKVTILNPFKFFTVLDFGSKLFVSFWPH